MKDKDTVRGQIQTNSVLYSNNVTYSMSLIKKQGRQDVDLQFIFLISSL